MKFTIEFRRVTGEKAFLSVVANNENAAILIGSVVSADDPRLKFEPMSSTMEIASVKPAEPASSNCCTRKSK